MLDASWAPYKRVQFKCRLAGACTKCAGISSSSFNTTSVNIKTRERLPSAAGVGQRLKAAGVKRMLQHCTSYKHGGSTWSCSERAGAEKTVFSTNDTRAAAVQLQWIKLSNLSNVFAAAAAANRRRNERHLPVHVSPRRTAGA